jgi:hypothetical protein
VTVDNELGAAAARDRGPERQIRIAVGVHVLLFPWWLLAWALFGGLVGGGADFYPEEEAAFTSAAIAVNAVGLGCWITLLVKLGRWGREGRDVTWRYPLLWAVCTTFSFYFSIALLFPGFRRWITPPRPVLA